MGAAANLVGRKLPGRDGVQWLVKERVTSAANDHTPGQYSIGYRVESDNGLQAFLKATDVGLLADGGNLIDRMYFAANHHQFERKILDYCRGSNMDKVATAIDYGEVVLLLDDGRDVVFYIVFELAEGDIRVQIQADKRLGLLWSLGALHQLAIAISQLHTGGICHNDIKPANFLYFNNAVQKLTDLGCATSDKLHGNHDDKHDVGDPVHAPPEVLYAETPDAMKTLCSVDARRAGDLYQLGSIAFFVITGRPLTPAIVERMAPEHSPPSRWGGWSGSLATVIPYWREAFGRAITEVFDVELPHDSKGELTYVAKTLRNALLELAEPDFVLRGHPENRSGQQDRRGTERYISLFDRLRMRLAVDR